MSDDAERERARYEALAALVDNYRRERDEALARCETLRDLADVAAYEQGVAQRRMMDAQRERDEARAEATSSLAMARIADEKHGWKCAEVDMLRGVGCMEDGDGPCGVCRKCAYRRGAEAMREACLRDMERFMDADSPYPGVMAHSIRALPIPEEP